MWPFDSSCLLLQIKSMIYFIMIYLPQPLSTFTRTQTIAPDGLTHETSISQSVTGTQGGNLITQQQVDAITA